MPMRLDLLTRREALALAALAAATPWSAVRAATAGALLKKAIPSSGEQIPVVGLGTNNYSPANAEERAARVAALERLIELGGRVIDTAPAYRQSEATIGELLAEIASPGKLFIATKITAADGDLAAAEAMFEESFKRLRVKTIDLLQVHNLSGMETLAPRLTAWKAEKRIRYTGATTSQTSQHPAMLDTMRRHALDFVQVDYSIANRAAADTVLPLAIERKMAVLVNMPFGGRRDGNIFGRVAGKELPAWAADYGIRSWGQFFLKYVVSHPAVTCAIPGMTKVSHVEDNLGAARGPMPDAKTRKRMEEWWDANAA